MYNKNKIIISTIVVALIVILSSYFVIKANQNDKTDFNISAIDSGEEVEAASSSLGKNITESENEYLVIESVDNTTNTENVTNESTKATNTKVQNESSNNTANESTNNTIETVTEEVIEDPNFIMPAEGEIIRDYAKDKLVYSDTLKEWVTHLGIDIKAEKTSIVKAAADGQISSIKNDPRYGLTIVIQHCNGYSTVYSNLLTAEFVKVGENVTQGQTIGTVGNTAAFEILDESHLHFEILKDGIQIDPNMYIH